MLKVTKTGLNGVLLIEPASISSDFRGTYIETYNKKLYKEAGIDISFVQDDISVSVKNVLRGIHGDDLTWKLVSCHYGEFFLVVVNWDDNSPQFSEWESFILSDQNHLQVLIPPKFGNAHLVLSDMTIFHYKQSTYYDRSRQFTVLWNDPRLNIPWPTNSPILSKRDSGEET